MLGGIVRFVPFGDYFSLIWNDCYLEDAVRFQRG